MSTELLDFILTTPHDQLARLAYDLLADIVLREEKDVRAVSPELTEDQVKAVVRRRVSQRFPRAFGTVG